MNIKDRPLPKIGDQVFIAPRQDIEDPLPLDPNIKTCIMVVQEVDIDGFGFNRNERKRRAKIISLGHPPWVYLIDRYERSMGLPAAPYGLYDDPDFHIIW